MSNVRAIHERVIEIATQGDAAWFEKGPDRRIRIRNAVPQEFNGILDEPPVGMTWRAIVVEAQPGVRARQPVALPIGIENDEISEQELFGLFLQAAPAEAKGIIDHLRKVKLAGVPKPGDK
jgi:hypothetical protein